MTKILFCDDEINIRELLSKALNSEGYQVTTVPSGEQAQDIVFKEAFDLIILDIDLGGVSGINVLKKIRENNDRIPVIMYSGCITQDIEAEAREAGANEVLRKDIGISHLVKQIGMILNVKDRISQGLTVRKDKPILVVDDTQNIRDLLKDFFNKKGYRVIEAASGEKGLEVIRSTEVAVVLLDMQMPGMDGLETLEKIFKINPKMGVVMATAVQDDDKVTKAVEMGAYGYVLKPFDFLYMELVVMSKLAIAESVA